MIVSRGDETREVLQPSLLPVPDHGVQDVIVSVYTTRYNHCVSNRVRDGAGKAVIKNVINLMIISPDLTYCVSYLSPKPGSWLASGVIKVDVLQLSSSSPPMR